MIVTDKEMIQVYERELESNMIRLTKNSISQHEASKLAQKAACELDWSNSILQHKGIGWIAGQFLIKTGYSFNYDNRTYELIK